jgi:NAD(P)-dependent dehydrogenase (short-subunit alcohol dehydrogenase family)
LAVDGTTVVVGGSAGLGRQVAKHFADAGRPVVIAGRDGAQAARVASELGPLVSSVSLDLCRPGEIGDKLTGIAAVDHLVITPVDRTRNSVSEHDAEAAMRLATMKLVGYTQVVHCLLPVLHEASAVLLFGGASKDRPYPGSTTVTSVNGAISAMVTAFALELAPIRVNAIHPGVVGDSPAWQGSEAFLEDVLNKTPARRLVTMQDVVGAAAFLLENRAVNGVNLQVDAGWTLTG